MTGDRGEHTGSSRSSNSTIKRFPLSPKRLVFIRVVVVEGHDGAVIKKSEKAHKGCCRIAIMADTVTKISRKDNRCKLNVFCSAQHIKLCPMCARNCRKGSVRDEVEERNANAAWVRYHLIMDQEPPQLQPFSLGQRPHLFPTHRSLHLSCPSIGPVINFYDNPAALSSLILGEPRSTPSETH